MDDSSNQATAAVAPDRPCDPRDLTAAMLCAEIFRRHGDVIRIKKPQTAIPNLVKILPAALDISSRTGFHAMTMRSLAEASGLSMGALYTYVDGKETLVRMILGAVAHAVEWAVAPFEPDEVDDPKARLDGLIRRHVHVTEVMQRWFYFAFLEVKTFDRAARAMAISEELRTEQMLADAIQAGIAAGRFIEGEPSTLAGLIKPLLQDWYLKRWKYRQRGITPARYVETVTDFVDRSLSRSAGTLLAPARPIRKTVQKPD